MSSKAAKRRAEYQKREAKPTPPPGWTIIYNPKPGPYPSPDWDYIHDDYDYCTDSGSNGLAGSCETYEGCLREIEEIEDER